MRFIFVLIDRYGNQTPVDEPIGWDSFSTKLKRHADRHGTFREIQTNRFQFTGVAADLLRTEYEQYGIRGNYKLRILGKCGAGLTELYLGQVAFDNYQSACGEECYVSVDLDQVGAVIDFINRFDQQVDISKLVAFDGVTALSDYSSMVKTVTLPSKAILLRGMAQNTTSHEYLISQDSGWFPVSPTGFLQGSVTIPFDNTTTNSIKDFSPQVLMDYLNYSNSKEYTPELIYNNPTQDLNCTGTLFNLDFRVKGIYKNLVFGSGNSTLTLVLKKGKDTFNTNATNIQVWTLYSGANNVINQAFDITYTGTVTLQPGEKLWLSFFLTYSKNTNYSDDVRIQVDPETYFNASVSSKCDPTPAKVYLLNETISRVIESITENQLKLYSSYFGRTDSQPYAMAADGCGSVRALTTGLDIRRAKLSDGSNPKLFLSMTDIFNSLSAIDNIGIGTEGTDKIRMENWKYFYQNSIVFYCTNVTDLQKTTQAGEHYSVFKTGYDKWEAQDYDGLDEFLTKREFHTSLSQVQNTLEKVAKWIASGYAWEATRRKGNDTKDWTYDNDTFLICLTKKFTGSASFTSASNSFNIVSDPIFQIGDQINITGTVSNNGTYTITNVVVISNSIQVYVSGTLVNETAPNAVISDLTNPVYKVETGNILSAANLLDPPSVYNFRISPIRNAMRWFDRIAACYRNITSGDKLSFSSGDGNYLAKGQLADSCALEAGVIAENNDISLASFLDQTDGTPILHPERVVFTYPITMDDYLTIQGNPNGLIAYNCKTESGYGWIDELEYTPEAGTAKFTLIPKIES